MLVALLGDAGYQGFEEGESILEAFIDQEDFNEDELRLLVEVMSVDYSLSIEEGRNWNAIWESSFEPVIIPGFVAVRADFHTPVKEVDHEILITPKMSFGTGHHATTYLMMERMRMLDFHGKSVLDFGAGTGILAILSEKLGAKAVDAIDNDPQCLLSMEENLPVNDCTRTRAWVADRVPEGQYDIILANINKHILLAAAKDLKAALSPYGELILSGLLTQDEADIRACYEPLLGQATHISVRNNWICLAFKNV
jgi:ribosomal protein L11 methyltransferase